MKSSIKTFLKGKNPYDPKTAKLKGSKFLSECIVDGISIYDCLTFADGHVWNIDVLDDGTCVTYCCD